MTCGCVFAVQVMRCAEIKRVLSDIFLFKNLNEEQGTTLRDCEHSEVNSDYLEAICMR